MKSGMVAEAAWADNPDVDSSRRTQRPLRIVYHDEVAAAGYFGSVSEALLGSAGGATRSSHWRQTRPRRSCLGGEQEALAVAVSFA